MKRILITGASGGVGSWLRKLLKPHYELVLTDVKPPSALEPQETFIAADLADAAAIERATQGVEGIVHLGGQSIEASWETILRSNIEGTYNLFEAARKQGVKRVVFASTNHAAGFYPRAQTIDARALPLPDSRYGVSKAFGEALGALYAYKYGLGVLCIRIGNVNEAPIDERRLSIWVKPADLASLVRIGLEREGLVFEVVYGMSDNARGWWDNSRAGELGYKPEGKSEEFTREALAAQAQLAADPVGDYFQGGPFCSQEFEGELSRIQTFTRPGES
jgi:uronate dehydrogenase